MAHRNALTAALSALALSLLLLLTGCDFDSSYAGGSSVSEAGTSSLDPNAFYTASVGGSVGDGPIVGAAIKVFSSSGELLPTGTLSDNTADYSLSIRTQGRNYPLTIVADGGTDIVTNREPDFKLVTTVMKPGNGQTANLNPYSTLIVKAAQHAGGINDENIAKATEAVVSRYGFGLDPVLVPEPLFTLMDDSNVHLIVKASETMSEMVRRTRNALWTVNFQVAGVDGKPRVIDGDDVVKALAADLVDGWVDGKGAKGYDRRIAAVANVASSAVMVEAMANQLHVYDVDSTMYMDNAIRQIRPNAPASSNTRNVSIPAEALEQSRRSLRAAKIVKNDSRISEIYERVAGAKPGTKELDALSSDGIQTMSSAFHNPLNDAVLAAAYILDGTQLEQINGLASMDPSDPVIEEDVKQDEDTTSDPVIEEDVKQDEDTTSDPVIEEDVKQDEDTTSDPVIEEEEKQDDGTTSDPVIEEDTPAALWSNDGWLQFDGGEGSMLNTGLSLTELSSTSFTVEAMVQYTGPISRTWTPIFGAASDVNRFFVGKVNGTNELRVWMGGLGSYGATNHNLFDGQERHLALVFDAAASAFRVFVDHVLISTETGVSGSFAATNDLLIGGVGHDANQRWEGWIGPHRVTNRVLKPEQFLGSEAEPVAPRPNRAPTISGTPQTALVVHNPWTFKPTASDPDGDKLTFSIKNKPEWASFDTQTGDISGTPGAKGTHPDIIITVSDGRTETSLSVFTLQVDEPTLGTATVSWEPPTTRTDGSTLTDLAGYRVYYGKDQASLTHMVEITEVGRTSEFIGNLDTGTWYFAVTAVDSQGLESLKSEIGSKTIM